MTKYITFILTSAAIVFLYGSKADAQPNHHYPLCSPVAHEVQGSWQRGEITRSEAEDIIESCLAWEDKQ